MRNHRSQFDRRRLPRRLRDNCRSVLATARRIRGRWTSRAPLYRQSQQVVSSGQKFGNCRVRPSLDWREFSFIIVGWYTPVFAGTDTGCRLSNSLFVNLRLTMRICKGARQVIPGFLFLAGVAGSKEGDMDSPSAIMVRVPEV